MKQEYENYHSTRFKEDRKRRIVWKVLANHLKRHISGKVADVGCGRGEFLSCINVREKYGLDIVAPDKFPKDAKFIKDFSWNLHKHVSNADCVVMSNILEHLDEKQLNSTMISAKKALSQKGKLIILQPNFRYSYKTYFDDYTHKKVFTHVSMHDYLQAHGFEIVEMHKKFLPFSLKSRLPVIPFFVKLYILSPIKPFAGQMLFIARKRKV